MIGSLRFAGELSPWFGILIAISGGGAVAWLYYRETRDLDSPYRLALPLLRALAVAVVILILTGPIWHRRQVIGTLGKVTFAVDVSQSMSISDSVAAESSPSRLDRASRLLIGDTFQSGWLGSLEETHEVDVIGFGDGEATSLWSSTSGQIVPTTLPLRAEASRTDLSSALSSVLRRQPAPDREARDESTTNDDPIGRHAVVLVSDGRDTVRSPVAEVTDRLAEAGIVLHTVGMGSADEPADLGIIDVDHPDNVAADGILSGRILLKQIGLDEHPIRLRIESAGMVVWQKDFDVAAAADGSVPFHIDVDELLNQKRNSRVRGVERTSIILDLNAVIESAETHIASGPTRPLTSVDRVDFVRHNNQFPFRVAASIRNRQLLILDGSSRWEIRYLRNLFGRDPAWDVTSIIFGPGTDTPRLIRGDEEGEFPRTDKAWATYDAVILGEIPPQQLTPNDAYQLREFVTRGGGLILIDGRYDRMRALSEGLIADLIPVRYLDGQSRIDVRSIRPTMIGRDQDALNLTGESSDPTELWELLPSPRSTSRIAVSDGAEVWADAVGVDGRESPWLVTRLFGAGRVFFVSSDETWRWRYKVADRFHARFWNQLMASAVQPPYSAHDEFVSIATDQIEYGVGMSPRVRVRLQNPKGELVGDSTVDALFIGNDPLVHHSRVVATVPLDVEDPTRGTYSGRAPPLPPGAYTIRIRASGFDESSFLASTPIWVAEDGRGEWNDLSLDSQTLTSLAAAAGGEYFHESRADELLSRLQPLSDGRVVESDILLWQSYYWFAVVIILLAIEWYMRKKTGLV